MSIEPYRHVRGVAEHASYATPSSGGYTYFYTPTSGIQ